MRWADAVREMTVAGSAPADAEISAVEYDSRAVRPGAAFVAMRGGSTDGNRFVDAALAQGAAAVVTDAAEVFARLRRERPELALAQVRHGRRALAELSAAFFGHAERRLKLSAVTGTNGKTTVAYLLEQMLRADGRGTVLLGTVETRVMGERRDSPHTTPEARDTLEIFAAGVRAGATEAVMEMSSHALDQERVWGLPVDVAIFTNLTQDHLDYHGTMERYAAAKARLFAGVGAAAPRVAVLNADDPASAGMASAFGGVERFWYGIGADAAAYRATEIATGLEGTSFRFTTPCGAMRIESPLYGRVNVANLLAAMCAALARGLTLDALAESARALRPAPGRFQRVEGSAAAGFAVVVDYAHTDDALRNVTAFARELVRGERGRVITVFGCGGDRDRSKRPRMGRAAGEGSDLVVLTSDNPRSEEPMAILEDALAGVRTTATECVVEPDRAAAIRVAVGRARRGDLVLIAGKGHEKTQTLRDGAVPFDDVEEADAALRELVPVAQARGER